MEKLRFGIESYLPAPDVATVQDIGITSGAVVGGEVIQTVNALRLHGFLGNKSQFSNWMQERIEQYGFVAEVDFTTIKENSLKGRHSTEHHVSQDMAKELAMVARTDKGREARKYFIECEKKLLRSSSILPTRGLPSAARTHAHTDRLIRSQPFPKCPL